MIASGNRQDLLYVGPSWSKRKRLVREDTWRHNRTCDSSLDTNRASGHTERTSAMMKRKLHGFVCIVIFVHLLREY